MKLNFIPILLVATILASISGCSRKYLFDGIVVDSGGNPIAGAVVLLNPSDWPAKSYDYPDKPPVPGLENVSEADGSFKATWGYAVGVKSFRMVVIKDGFKDNTQIVKADAKGIRVVMEHDITDDENAE